MTPKRISFDQESMQVMCLFAELLGQAYARSSEGHSENRCFGELLSHNGGKCLHKSLSLVVYQEAAKHVWSTWIPQKAFPNHQLPTRPTTLGRNLTRPRPGPLPVSLLPPLAFLCVHLTSTPLLPYMAKDMLLE